MPKTTATITLNGNSDRKQFTRDEAQRSLRCTPEQEFDWGVGPERPRNQYALLELILQTRARVRVPCGLSKGRPRSQPYRERDHGASAGQDKRGSETGDHNG